MGRYFKSYIAYGVKVTYEKFEQVVGEEIWEDDSLRIENNGASTGWAIDPSDSRWAFFGKIVHDGVDNGNDDPLGGDGDCRQLYLLTDEELFRLKVRIENELGGMYAHQAKYYVIGEYS